MPLKFKMTHKRIVSMLQTLGERIQKKRKQLNLKQPELAKKLGLTHSSISNWEADKFHPSAKNLHELASIFNCSIDWLLNGGEEENQTQKDFEINQFLRQTFNIAKIPVLSDDNIINNQREITRYIVTDRKEISKKSFGYIIANNAMQPSFFTDDIVIIDPEITPETDYFVLAKMADSVFFRKFIIKEISNEKINFLLSPLSSHYPTIHSDQCSIEILGTMVEHRSYRKS